MIKVWVYFCALCSVPLICVSVFMPVPDCFDYYGLVKFESNCSSWVFMHLIHWDCSGVKSSCVVNDDLSQRVWRLSSEQRKLCFRFSLLIYIDLLTLRIDKATTNTSFLHGSWCWLRSIIVSRVLYILLKLLFFFLPAGDVLVY